MKKVSKLLMIAMLALSSACSSNNTLSASIKDGDYETVGQGHGGDVKVKTTIADGVISSVTVLENSETESIATSAIEQIPLRIVENNSVGTDTVTGATETSNAIIEAVKLAIEQAGGKVEDFSNKVNNATSNEVIKEEADVVVVGGGAAGVSAALSAAQEGANVILLEKSSAVGGVSIIAGGMMGINSADQIAAGADTFTIEEVVKDWQDYNCWMSDAMLFYNVANNSGKTIDWLEENGMEFDFMGNSQAAHADGFPTYHIYANQEDKMGYYTALVESFESLGGKVYYETAGKELMSENDAITGIKAEKSDGTVIEISTDSVVLATGGFGANAQMIEEEVGFPLETFTTGTQTGDGATMSQAIGAGKGKTIQQYHGVTSYSGIQTGSGMDEIAKVIYLPTSVWVNSRGSRFAPEDLNYDTALSSNAAATQGEYYFSIVSDAMVTTLEQEGSIGLGVDTAVYYEPTVPLFDVDQPWVNFRTSLEQGVSDGIVYKGETIEELATAMGVDSSTLKVTMDLYNQNCIQGEDSVLGKDRKYLVSMEEGPYYAVKARAVSLGGIGGVLVNSNLQVIKEDGTIINGLYAAGNDIAEIYNNSYPLIEGVTLMTALTGGHLVGTSAAQFALSK